MSSQLETRSCSFGKPKSLFGFSLPHSPSLLVQSLVHSYSFGEPNTQLGFSLPQCTSLLCSITALPETSQQSEAAPSVNPVLCPDSPFHSLLSLFGVLFAAAPLVNPILCLDSPFHRLLFGQSFCLLSCHSCEFTSSQHTSTALQETPICQLPGWSIQFTCSQRTWTAVQETPSTHQFIRSVGPVFTTESHLIRALHAALHVHLGLPGVCKTLEADLT